MTTTRAIIIDYRRRAARTCAYVMSIAFSGARVIDMKSIQTATARIEHCCSYTQAVYFLFQFAASTPVKLVL